MSDNSLINRGLGYWKTHGAQAFLVRSFQFLRRKAGLEPPPKPALTAALAAVVHEHLPVRMFPAPARQRLVQLMVESRHYDRLFNNVDAAFILSALLAKQLGCGLRITTRCGAVVRRCVSDILKQYQVDYGDNIDFRLYNTELPNCGIEAHPADIFITTSWQATLSLKDSVKKEQLFCLLSEDERMRHPHDDAYLWCNELYRNADINYFVVSRLLHEHFASEGMEMVSLNASLFEPPIPVMSGIKSHRDGRYNLALFGDPLAGKSLFYTVLEVLDGLISSGAIDTEQWRIHLAGGNIPEFEAGQGVSLHIEQSGKRDWHEFMGEMDLGLALVYGPEPGYLPLAMAASGMVAVTNQYGVKKSLDHYSSNILCRRLCVQDLIDGLKEGMQLVASGEQRQFPGGDSKRVEDVYKDALQRICKLVNV